MPLTVWRYKGGLPPPDFHDWSWNDLPEQGLEVAVGEDWNVVLHCVGWKELSERAVR